MPVHPSLASHCVGLSFIPIIGGSSIGAHGARAPAFWRATHANYNIATREAHILGLLTVE